MNKNNKGSNNGIDFIQPMGIDNLSKFGIRFTSGINEFVDNSIEAKASNIFIAIENNGSSTDVIIMDDGHGMNSKNLQYALSFGGEGEGVKEKNINDIGKFHSGMTIASMSLSNNMKIFSNNGEGWVENYINTEEVKEEGKIYSSKKSDIPYEASRLINNIKNENGLEIDLKTGTIILLKDIDKEIISEKNFKTEVEELFNNSCIRYYEYLKENSIYIIVNDLLCIGKDNVKSILDIMECKSIPPLLDDDKLLEENGLEIFAKFEYKNILTVREILPYSKTDDSMDIQFVVIKKKNKKKKMINSHNLVKINMENQGSYFGRNDLVLIRAEKIGYNKKHNDFNGVRTYSKLNGNWDNVLGINVNKSVYNLNSKFVELLKERISCVYTHLRKVIRGNEKFNPPVIVGKDGRKCNPIINEYLNKSEKMDESYTDKEKVIEKKSEIDYKGDVSKEQLNEKVSEFNHKNEIIFAAIQKPKGNIDTINGFYNIYINDKNCYIYDKGKNINDFGVKKEDIEEWCKEKGIPKDEFYKKIRNSIPTKAKEQIKFYDYYMEKIYNRDSKKNFFLFPEVYVNLNINNGDGEPQRADFMLVLPNKEKIIIEIDGIGHYADEYQQKWYASEKKYAKDREFDRNMIFKGYKVVRFSNYEIRDDIRIVEKFFEELFK